MNQSKERVCDREGKERGERGKKIGTKMQNAKI